MTSKELLYVEDALGHEKYFQTKCNEVVVPICLPKTAWPPTLMQMAEKHRQLFRTFYGLL